ncbi:AcvB/VirJ family lysyl-phosphatidylglycerol hydrolase [Pseudomonas sp. RP23018S]|uniref:virulence factor family protein n=1 Tax=Pseudomonas sp. RP23018S TaxID=3096037 RepID=UPI002AC9FA41|nr:AcvB/VirJ family lysyl-phosphatidylglycerol hydrolase [Pseudomonas sp. RP23018S]MDZ5601300.1 AcvB/VirJ family lysyl-phosphatidylglycerol hydrolase [Pseudomonas sp. RP23018S]
MIRRYWLYLLIALAVAAAAASLAFWLWTRPAPEARVEHLSLPGGTSLARATPGVQAKAHVAIGVPKGQALTDKQLLDLSQAGEAQLVQVLLPTDDCAVQQQLMDQAIAQLGATPTVVAGIGPGAAQAWRWLAAQGDDKARAISVDFKLEQPSCTSPLPKTAAHGHWNVAWNDNPDDASAGFVRDQPNAETSISDYDIHLPQVLKSQLTQVLVGRDGSSLNIPVVEVPAGQATDTVTLFLSGDGGWRDLDRDVAGEMAKLGYPVVGIDTLRYYWQHKTPEQSAADLSELMHHYRQKWGTKRFVLTGYSFGADVLPATFNRLSPEDQQRIDAVILLAFARSGSFEIEVEGWLGKEGQEAPTGPEMAKMPAAKVVCIYGMEEADESGCTESTAVGERVKLPGGHHFDENYPALAKRLIKEIEARQGKAAAAQQQQQ